jgi:hypothetical protein
VRHSGTSFDELQRGLVELGLETFSWSSSPTSTLIIWGWSRLWPRTQAQRSRRSTRRSRWLRTTRSRRRPTLIPGNRSMTQEGLVSTRIEGGPVLLPSRVAQPGAASIAGPEVDEQPAAAVVGRADVVEAVMGAVGLHVELTPEDRRLFPHRYESHPPRDACPVASGCLGPAASPASLAIEESEHRHPAVERRHERSHGRVLRAHPEGVRRPHARLRCRPGDCRAGARSARPGDSR